MGFSSPEKPPATLKRRAHMCHTLLMSGQSSSIGYLVCPNEVKAKGEEAVRSTLSRRKLFQVILDCALVLVSTGCAFELRFAAVPDSPISFRFWIAFSFTLMAVRIPCLWRSQLYRLYWRYLSNRDLLKIVGALAFSSALFYGLRVLAGQQPFPRLTIIEWMLSVLLIGGTRMAYQFFHLYGTGNEEGPHHVRRVLIAGAGDLGEGIAREIIRRRNGQRVIGFVDSDPTKHGALIHGVPVFGGDEQIEQVVASQDIDDVIIAIPGARGSQIRRIVSLCEKLPVQLRIFPSFDSLVAGEMDVKRVRDVAVEDLLRRPPVKINLDEIAGYISGERVLITGAGGSIGSELCRQVSGLSPEKICLLGHGENSIFEIEQELRSDFGADPFPVICDIQDFERLERVFARFRPTVVFHAAAHKHVPMMEMNPEEAIKNNVTGTRNLAALADRYGVRKFVMISTDKAVNPTSIMGASKRIGEMIIQAMAQHSRTEFVAVRFGNVLGSRGSVVPLMKRQIARGGPVTVTHPDVVRYFMTIPEAVQLVIQAGALGKGGEIFMLDMGEPVRIMELARDLIRLSGLVPGKDIEIKVTGLRPGEKLFEELLTAQEGTGATRHEKIFIASATAIRREELERAIVRMEAMASDGDSAGLRQALKELIPTYTPYYGSAERGLDSRPPAPLLDEEESPGAEATVPVPLWVGKAA